MARSRMTWGFVEIEVVDGMFWDLWKVVALLFELCHVFLCVEVGILNESMPH